MRILFYILSLLLICHPALWAADVYIDLDWTGTESGTFAQPYNSVTDLTPSASDDYYFRCGSSETLSSTFLVTATGNSEADPITFSAYYDSGGEPPGTAPTGTAVHEDDSPTFGSLCGNGAQKPILKWSLGTGLLFNTNAGGSQYLEINSIQFHDANEGMYIKSNYNDVRYCRFYNLYWGIRVGIASDGDYNMIEHNDFDLNDSVDEDGNGVDPIKLQNFAQNNTIQYNRITSFDHIGILATGDNNIIQYNYIFGDLGYEDVCIGTNPQGDSNIWRYNYCKQAGVGFQGGGGDSNEVYGNIFDCGGIDTTAYGCIHFYSGATHTNRYNRVYNNVIYDHDDVSNSEGIKFYSGGSSQGAQEGNEFTNNIILKVGNRCFFTADNSTPASIGDNYYWNNSCYQYGTNTYSSIETVADQNAADFNSGFAFASGNLDTDPGLNNPASGEFWPSSSGAAVVGAGCDMNKLGEVCRDAGYTANENILDPDTTTLTSRIFGHESQPASWFIGPYGYESTTGSWIIIIN